MKVSLSRMLNDVINWKEGQDGIEMAVIKKAEKRLGLLLPTELKNFYTLCGNNKIVTQSDDRLLHPNELYVRNHGLVFMHEHQDVMFWAIKDGDLKKDNPPVQQGNFEERRWYCDANTLTAFLSGVCYWQIAMGFPEVGRAKATNRHLEAFEAKLDQVQLNGKDAIVDLYGFHKRELAVSVSKSAKKILVGAKTSKILQAFSDEFGIQLDSL